MDYLLVIFLPVPSLSLPFAPASPLSHGCHLPATGRIWAGSNIAHSQNKITSEGDGNYATRHILRRGNEKQAHPPSPCSYFPTETSLQIAQESGSAQFFNSA